MKSPAAVSLAWSPMLYLAVGLAHITPLASVFAEGVPAWVRWLVVALILISGASAWHIALGLRQAVLRPHAEGAQLLLPSQVLEGRMLASSIDMGLLVVLQWREEVSGKVRRYALLRDGFSAAEWRVLKIWLRWQVMKLPA